MKAIQLFIVAAISALLLFACQKDDLTVTPTDDATIEVRDNAIDYFQLDGIQPEGIVVGKGNTAYVGGFFLGSILEINLKTGEMETLVEGTPGLFTIGLSFDDRSNYVYAAGGNSGALKVYNTNTGVMEGFYQLFVPSGPFDGWLNDIIVTRDAAYVTNSLSPTLYKLPLGPKGSLPDMDEVEELPLVGEWFQSSELPPGLPVPINANGIDATPNGKMLVLANSVDNKIYKVDPETGYAEVIDIDAPIFGPDGILLKPCSYDDGYILYIVHAPNAITKVKLNEELEFESVVEVLTDPGFQSPTTIDIKGNGLYVVNARFDSYNPFEPHPNAVFTVVRVDK